ncbi:MAG: nuclear transport factor 2 family protein [Acidimicrobiia bacterium]|nr:nuclear transport factor 2 family protein [Acidimicrobiia bacterium]
MHPNAQLVVRGFQAFAEGDMATLRGLFADDATWHLSGRNKWSGDYTGPDEILQYMSGVAGEITINNELHAVLADDDHVVALVNTSSSREGETYSGNNVYVFHVGDGKVTEAWVVPRDQYAQDEFWAG